jgi:capsular polysaccharide export protein
VVTINSTVGLSALAQGRATKTLGRAFYDLPGLTHQARFIASGTRRGW